MTKSYKIRRRYESYVMTPGIVIDGVSLTQQHFKQECDINYIRAMYVKTGWLPQPREGYIYTDNKQVDLLEALSIMERAQNDFDQLPSTIRQYFANDPLQFVSFVDNPQNIELGIQLGLYERPQSQPQQSVQQQKVESQQETKKET